MDMNQQVIISFQHSIIIFDFIYSVQFHMLSSLEVLMI